MGRDVGTRWRLSALVGLVLLACLWPAASYAAEQGRDDWYRLSAKRVLLEPVYRTQRDGSRFAGSNCGPAALGMILDAYGLNYSTLDLRQMTHTYQGTWPNRGGTALQHIAHVAEDFSIAVHGLYDVPDQQFHRWSIDEVASEIRSGRWVIPLVRYNLLTGHEST